MLVRCDEAASCILEHGAEIRECLARLRFEGVPGHSAGCRIDPGLACRIHEIVNANRLRVRPDAGHARAIDDFGGQSHATSSE